MGKKQNNRKHYAIYLRCSTDDQREGDFTTIDTQREINRMHINERGGTLVGEYIDDGKTGTNLSRPGWKSMLADAEAGKFDVVCVTYMSRLGRGDACAAAEYLLGEAGVSVDLVKEKFTDDTAGFVNKQVVRLVDAMYVEQVRGWTKTKMEQMVQQGYYCGGTVPFGYRVESISDTSLLTLGDKQPSKRFVIDEAEAEIVCYAYDLFLEKRSIADVVRYLKSVTNRIWTINTATNLLGNEMYIGNYRFGSWYKEKSHPAIIDNEVWETAVQFLDSGKRSPRITNSSDGYTYYLRGRVRCPHCGCNYTNGAAKGGAVRYYQCLHDTKQISKCPVGRVNADALHKSILKEIGRVAKHRTVAHNLIAESGGWGDPSDAIKALRGQLAKRKQFNAVQINNITLAIAEGRHLKPLLDRLDKLEKELIQTTEELQSVELQIAQSTTKRPLAEQVGQAWESLYSSWEYATEEAKTEIMAAIVQEVIVQTKSHVSLVLTAIPEVHGSEFVTEYSLGAVDELITNHPPLLMSSVEIKRGRGKAKRLEP